VYLAEREAGLLEPVIAKRRFGRRKVDPRRPLSLFEVSQNPVAFSVELGSAVSADDQLLHPRLTGRVVIDRPTRFVEAVGEDNSVWLVDDLGRYISDNVRDEAIQLLRRESASAVRTDTVHDRLIEALRPNLDLRLADLGMKLVGSLRLLCPNADDLVRVAELEQSVRLELAERKLREQLVERQSAAEAEEALRQLAHEAVMRDAARVNETATGHGALAVAERVERLLTGGLIAGEPISLRREELDLRLLLDALSYEVAERQIRRVVASRQVFGIVSMTAERLGHIVEMFVGLLILLAVVNQIRDLVNDMSLNALSPRIATSALMIGGLILLLFLFRRWMSARDRRAIWNYASHLIKSAESEARQHGVGRLAHAIEYTETARSEILQSDMAVDDDVVIGIQRLINDLKDTKRAIAASSYGEAIDRRSDLDTLAHRQEVERIASFERAIFEQLEVLIAMCRDLCEQALHNSRNAIAETVTGIRESLLQLNDIIDQRRRLL
jgi:hypothetical protein